jgi:hypothetical protein
MMTDSDRLIARHPLDNGLTLEFWDHSRVVAGDRWFVGLETRIAIPVRTDALPPELQGSVAQVVGALGAEITFSQKDERNFIAASEAPALLQEMQDRVLALAPGYFGHRDFAPRFIRGKYAELQAQQRWQRLDTRKGDAT